MDFSSFLSETLFCHFKFPDSLNTYLFLLNSVRMPGSVWLLPPCTTVWKWPPGRESAGCQGSPSVFSIRDYSPVLPVGQCLKILQLFPFAFLFSYSEHRGSSGPCYSLRARLEVKDRCLRMFCPYIKKQKLGSLFYPKKGSIFRL